MLQRINLFSYLYPTAALLTFLLSAAFQIDVAQARSTNPTELKRIIASQSAQSISLAELMNNAPTTHEKVEGLKDFRVVIPGVLYRGGNSGGGQQPLKAHGLKSLCDKGFSEAVYMYPNNFSERTATNACGLKYKVFGTSIKDQKAIYNFLAQVKNVIDTGKGPLYVHCWNGWHASGEMAAYALMQFCGLNGEQAQKYWFSNVPNGVVTRIRNFKTFEDLKISSDQQSRICPR